MTIRQATPPALPPAPAGFDGGFTRPLYRCARFSDAATGSPRRDTTFRSTPMTRSSRWYALLAAPLLTLALTGCQDTPLLTAPLSALAAALPAGSVEAVIQQEAGPIPGTVRLTVRVLAKDTVIAAYQGALTFTAGAFELVSVSTPDDTDGEAHLVNSTTLAAGRLPFAAYAPERFGTDEAFSVVVRPTLPLDAMHLSAALDVAGVASGRALAATSLRRSAGVRDAAGRMLTTVR